MLLGSMASFATWFVHDFSSTLFVFESYFIQSYQCLAPDWVEHDTHHPFASHIDIVPSPQMEY
jgi:hypothetical protein